MRLRCLHGRWSLLAWRWSPPCISGQTQQYFNHPSQGNSNYYGSLIFFFFLSTSKAFNPILINRHTVFVVVFKIKSKSINIPCLPSKTKAAMKKKPQKTETLAWVFQFFFLYIYINTRVTTGTDVVMFAPFKLTLTQLNQLLSYFVGI